jgi:apolipoprotein N-acyltransferase
VSRLFEGRILRPTRSEAIAALASAVLFAFAFPPFPPLLAACICLVPVAVAIARMADEGESVRAAVRVAFWFGLVGYALNLYWIAIALSLFTKLAILGYVAALIWLAPFVGAFGAALYLTRRATRWPLAILLPMCWTALELVLNYLSDLSFPWLPLGLAAAKLPIFAQIADLSSVRGVSFWIAATNGLIADAYLLRFNRRAVLTRVAAALGLAALVAGYGAWRIRTTETVPVAPIAVIQPNIPEDVKLQAEQKDRFVGILANLTREAFREQDPQLVLWPETALSDFLFRHPDWQDSLRALARVEPVPILTGVLDLVERGPDDYDYYNAAILTDRRGEIQPQLPYRKEFLVPIVERVPFLNPRWFSGMAYFGGFGRGKDQKPFVLPFGSVGTLICYESIFPQQSRHFRREGASLLVNITNDAWFGRSSAPYQHEAHLALRAIENRVGIVRAANTGISEYVDPLGRVHDATELFVPAQRTFVAETTNVHTLFDKLGDWLGALSLIGVIVLIVRDRRTRRTSTPELATTLDDPLDPSPTP